MVSFRRIFIEFQGSAGTSASFPLRFDLLRVVVSSSSGVSVALSSPVATVGRAIFTSRSVCDRASRDGEVASLGPPSRAPEAPSVCRLAERPVDS